MGPSWIGKWLKNKTVVYKVVYRDSDGRLLSMIVRKNNPEIPKEVGKLQRVYARRDGYRPIVRQAIAFESEAHALAFLASWPHKKAYEVWRAYCGKARRIKMVCRTDNASPAHFRRFIAEWGDPAAWISGIWSYWFMAGPPPAGSLLCRDLRIIKRVH